MSRGIRLLTDSKTSDRENGSVPKRPRPIMAETDCDVVHCPTMGGGGGGGGGERETLGILWIVYAGKVKMEGT